MTRYRNDGMWKLVLLAGLAGGTAEIAWVMLYGVISGTGGAEVARQVAASLWPAAAQWKHAPVLGIAVHMVLAMAVAAVIVPLLLHIAARSPVNGTIVPTAALALAIVWAMNFFVILPVVNPSFIALMPYGATFVSKLLFGVAAGIALQRALPAPARGSRNERHQR